MLLQVLNTAGIAVFAASGAVLGVRKDFDLWGILTVGVLTGVGGGILRDVLLGITPPASIDNWTPICTAAISSLVVFFFHPAFSELRRMILVLDAFGMGLFATTGAGVALDVGASAFAAVLVGMLTAIGGGILRDVLANEIPLLLQPADLYAIPALLGSALFVTGERLAPQWHAWWVVAAVILATGLRLLGLAFHWTLPTAPTRTWPRRWTR
ncbi:trimeric intracellular cation channel family protein [Gordonia desulfuricans]|uniref:Trimeric intracellular cation channel family protein n=1 Tax=Gordonia desulfuricans TaxID=89051 RepID=A0A7K3LMG1_9ACTN|nr:MULTISPECIES: trimeric intracellular cation channel family protein [Gordonia]EMP13394.1 membrane protein [Gordonia sp. NB41Y]NDK88697.1 trimeric intracellular cation channel family protein [Gordonia desulfuricans]WLP91882.1 trimeric intracellular cation channel family protein [Gordonia sp. NB41Y]